MRSYLNLGIVLSVAGVIAYYSLAPVPSGPYDTTVIDLTLVYHFAAYFGLAAALLLYFHDTTKGHVEAMLVAALFGASLELTQLQLPSRYFSLTDMGINLLGASLIFLDHRSRLVTRIIRIEDSILATLLDLDQ